MSRAALLVGLGFVLSGACTKANEAKPATQAAAETEAEAARSGGTPLFAAEAWSKEPAKAFESLVHMVAPDWQVTAGAVDLESASHLVIRDLRIATADAGTVLAFDSLELRGTDRAVDLTARPKGGGTVEVRLHNTPAQIAADVAIDAVRFGDGDGWRMSASDVPLQGTLNGRVSLRLPNRAWAKANGTIEIACAGCATGEVTIRPPTPSTGRSASAFAASGLTLPGLTLGDIDLRVELTEGSGTIALQAGGDADMTLTMTGELRAADPFAETSITACMSASLSEDARRTSPMLQGLVTVLARGPTSATLAMQVSGRLHTLRVRPTDSCN